MLIVRLLRFVTPSQLFESPNVTDNMRDNAPEQLADIDDFKTLRRSLTKRKFDPELWQTLIDFTRDLDKMRGDNILDSLS